MRVSRKILAVSMVLFAGGRSAMGDTLALSLDANGTVGSAPYWQVGASQASTATFDFAQIQPGAGLNLDSVAQNVKLVHAGVTGVQSITVARPTACDVGATSVTPADIALVINSVENTNNANVNFTIGTALPVKIRFKANYGTAFGAVSCSGPGSLTYTY